VCTHCSVGCSVIAEVASGVWIGQEPDYDSPINRGSHCCKGAAVRDDVVGERRLRYPVKLVDGQWERIPWDQAINEISDKLLDIRAKSGPDSVYWLGSAKFTNEAAYLNRKFAALWGTNNSDHQARMCHSTTVTGVANTWGYGAITNSYNDIRNARTIVVMGGNPAEAHPVSLQHILEGKELNRANMIVIDPRMTRTAAHATEFVRVRPGTHIPTIYGMIWHILKNGWEDKEFIRQRVYGLDDVREEVETLRIPVGVVVERRRTQSPWLDAVYRPVSILSGVPVTAPWTIINSNEDVTTLYAGDTVLELFRTETAQYQQNLASGTPSL
jgi:formate dehydrogenase major subunit